jgi:outer membrane protein OmpA-like peptidoglycan-associated protein
MRHGIRLATMTAVLSLVVGCASVEWTEQLLSKRQVEVEERFVKVETSVHEQGTRLDQVEVKVANIDTRLTETRDMVRSAQAPAPVVVRASAPDERPSRPTPERPARATRTLFGVIHVPFGFDRADLDPGAEAALGAILKELQSNPRLTIDLEGATDAVGRLDYNVRLSQRRVETVRRWLVGHGLERTRIVGSNGHGPLATVAVKDEVKRRVMVKLMTMAE